MKLLQHRLAIKTPGAGCHEITGEVAAWLAAAGAGRGLLTLFIRHTSASLLIQENAAPDVRRDLLDFLARLAPEEPGRYRHDDEGPDDMPAHIKAMLLPTHLAVPVADGRLLLGTWQGIYVVEHRRAPHRREIVLHFAGEQRGQVTA